MIGCLSNERKKVTQKINPSTSIINISKVTGIDVSKFQGNIQWDSLATKIQFAFCKATEGETYIDPEFEYNWNSIKENNIYRGAYHFYRSNDSPQKQADFFLKTVQPYLDSDLPLVLDIEQASIEASITKEQLTNDVIIFLKAIEKKTKKKTYCLF